MTRVTGSLRTGLVLMGGAIALWVGSTVVLRLAFEVRIEPSVQVLIGFVLLVVGAAAALVAYVRSGNPGHSAQVAETMESLYGDATMERLNAEDDRR